MKSLLVAGLTLGGASANIIFNHVPLTCDPFAFGPVEGKTGCLRGQICDDNGTYVPKPSSQRHVTTAI